MTKTDITQVDIDAHFSECCKSLQGVTRLITADILAEFIQGNEQILRYLIVTEKRGTAEEHTHFLIQGKQKIFNVYNLKKRFKQQLEQFLGYVPAYKNGEFNLTKCNDPARMAIYLQKEHLPNYAHGYRLDILKKLKGQSFEKKVSMTTAIGKLQEKLYLHQIDLEEYILSYRQLRNRYRKPDPHWAREADRKYEWLKTETTMKAEISQYLQNKNDDSYKWYERTLSSLKDTEELQLEFQL